MSRIVVRKVEYSRSVRNGVARAEGRPSSASHKRPVYTFGDFAGRTIKRAIGGRFGQNLGGFAVIDGPHLRLDRERLSAGRWVNGRVGY